MLRAVVDRPPGVAVLLPGDDFRPLMLAFRAIDTRTRSGCLNHSPEAATLGQHAMLEIHCIDSWNCPVVVCDICGERLAEASKAAVVFQNFQQDGAKLRLLHVHKGRIDGRTCHQEAEALLGAPKASVGWQELKAFMVDLSHNVGFGPAEMVEYDDQPRL